MSVGPSRGRLGTRPQSTDDTPSILVSDLFRGGVARSDALPVVRGWSSGGVSAEIEVTVIDERVECVYRSSLGRREARYVLEVSWTTPNFGGERPWLHCASCHRRCGRLFLDDPYLVCRQCARLRYPSQFGEKARHEERVKRAKQLRRSLGGEPVLGAPLPARPKACTAAHFSGSTARSARLRAPNGRVSKRKFERPKRDFGELSRGMHDSGNYGETERVKHRRRDALL